VVDDLRAARTRESRFRNRLAGLVERGHDFVTMLATERLVDGRVSDDNPPYVQFAWRDDLRLQVETQADHYRAEPYSETQHRLLRNLGYSAPYELGDDFCNWTIFRVAEGCEPRSVAALMIDTLWLVHGAHFQSWAVSSQLGVSFWTFQFWVSPTKRDIKGEIERRFRQV
jgi:hypothetical protein